MAPPHTHKRGEPLKENPKERQHKKTITPQ